MTQERRSRAYHVPVEALWGLMSRWLLPDVACFHFFEGVPDDVKVEDVWHDPLRRSFTFVLSHPSFEAVPEGEASTSAGPCAYETVPVRRLPGVPCGEASAYDALREENRVLREELARLRCIFGNEYLDESAVARGAYEQGRQDFEREVCEALAVLPEMLAQVAARIDWAAVRTAMTSSVENFNELLRRMSLPRPEAGQALPPPKLNAPASPSRPLPESPEGVLLWAVDFAPAADLRSGDPVTVGQDGLWRRAESGDWVYGHVEVDREGVPRLRGTVNQNSMP